MGVLMSRTPSELDALILATASADPSWWARVQAATVDADGCHTRPQSLNPEGYGRVRLSAAGSPVRNEKGKTPTVYTHRAALVIALGRPLAAGMTASHKCHDIAADLGQCSGDPCKHRSCMNPEHLAEESMRDNAAASPSTPIGVNIRKTHCSRCGQELAGANLIPSNLRQGFRACASCHRVRAALRRSGAVA